MKGVLLKSLNNGLKIDLKLKKQIDSVEPWKGILPVPEQQDQELYDHTQIVSIFEEMREAMLILGNPGSGKTTLLLELGKTLIEKAFNDPQLPIPVILILSTWSGEQQSFAEWLVDELYSRYTIPRDIGYGWVSRGELLLLLDGLDEVNEKYVNACVQAIKKYHQEHFVSLAVCSRLEVYKSLQVKLTLNGTVEIQALEQAQIIDVFIKHDLIELFSGSGKNLLGILDTPLLINIAALLSEEMKKLFFLGDFTSDLKSILFDTYIEKMFAHRSRTSPFSEETTRRWLAWLANRMVAKNQSVFLIESIQPDWLSSSQEQNWVIITLCVAGLDAAFVGALFIGPYFLYFVGLILFFIILDVWDDRKITPVETLTWSWDAFRNNFSKMMIGGIAIGLIGALKKEENVDESDDEERIFQFISNLVKIGLIFGLGILGIVGGLEKGEISKKTYPNQGIRLSLINALRVGMVSGLLGCLIGALVDFELSFFGLLIGLCSGLIFAGGYPVFQHYSLRLYLLILNYLPLNLVPFLDRCTEHIFLRKVGGGYIFIHRMLMEHFSEMWEREYSDKN